MIELLRRSRARFSLFGAALAATVTTAGLHAQEPEVIAVQVGRVITVSGQEIEGATILIEGGRIKAVGKDVSVPWNARVHKHPKGTAMPGLIACHSTMGLRVPNENVANAPFITVLDGIDPSAKEFKAALRDGVTAAHVIPANATRIGGQGAVIRTAGRTIAEMVIASPSAVKIALRPSLGETRMQAMAALRKTFFDLYLHVRDVAAEASPPAPLAGRPASQVDLASIIAARPTWADIVWDKLPIDKVDVQQRPMVDLVRGKLRAFIHCPSASDVFKAFELIESNGLKATLVLGDDAYKLGEVLRARKELGPVVLDADMVVWDADPDTGEERRHVTPRVLFDAGISFALQAGQRGRDEGSRFSRDGEDHLWYQAALLVRHGVPRAEALKSVTLTPARILGLEHRMGSLEPGKDANIAVFTGDPLDARSWVDLVLIEGKEVYRRDRDRDLELLLKEPEREF